MSIVSNPKGLDDEIAAGLAPDKALAKMQAKKYRCGACLRTVAYGGHCSTNLSGDASKWDASHLAFIKANGHLYEEIL
jgi:hypothetical protein